LTCPGTDSPSAEATLLTLLTAGCRRHTQPLSACPCGQGCMPRSSNACCEPVVFPTYGTSSVHGVDISRIHGCCLPVHGVCDSYANQLTRRTAVYTRLKCHGQRIACKSQVSHSYSPNSVTRPQDTFSRVPAVLRCCISGGCNAYCVPTAAPAVSYHYSHIYAYSGPSSASPGRRPRPPGARGALIDLICTKINGEWRNSKPGERL